MQSGHGRSTEQRTADAREAALRSAARLHAARDAAEHRMQVVLAERRLDRERRRAAEARTALSMYQPVDLLPATGG